MFHPTEEQQAVAACDLEPGQTMKIMAFAGTGKTSTLVAYAQARPGMRFLYVAFNKSVQLEAAARFPSNVVARTSHALAFRTHGYLHKDRLVPGFRANTVMQALGLKRYEDARFTMDTLANYLVSAAPKVAKWHIPFQARAFYEQCKWDPPDFVDLANRLGRRMCDKADRHIGMLHDGYLKLFQLSNPVLDFDCILLDEAQDINPVTAAIVLSQAQSGLRRPPASIILVGDSHQQIYSFRGARDTLQKISTTKTMYLTRSFRFDNNIARVANMVLSNFKGETRSIVGTALDKLKPKWDSKCYTVIARTNAAVFDKAVRLIKSHTLGFVGGVQSYRLSSLKDVYHLQAGRRELICDAYIKGFDDYGNLKAYAAAVEEIELLSICKVVEKYRGRLPILVEEITAKAVESQDAQITFTTAHKSKGLQWAHVLLMGDFLELVEDGQLIDPTGLDADEFNLIYVAMTRTIYNLRFDKESTLPAFIKLFQKLNKQYLAPSRNRQVGPR
jgi:F-box protein, helicase, 18